VIREQALALIEHGDLDAARTALNRGREAARAFREETIHGLNTTTSHGRLMLTVLGGLAEFERDLIRARTSEGRARAVANGARLGRKPTLLQCKSLDDCETLKPLCEKMTAA
jgi:hypothetical protein